MKFKGFLFYIILLCVPSLGSAGIFDCVRALIRPRSVATDAPIGSQRIAKNVSSDLELARRWLWSENEKQGSRAAGLNIASAETTEFMLSIEGWKNLNDEQMRSLLRVHSYLLVRLELNQSISYEEAGVTESDRELWRLRVPMQPLPD